jgi:hypothetical protein
MLGPLSPEACRLDCAPKQCSLTSRERVPGQVFRPLSLTRIGFSRHDTDPGAFFPLPPGEGQGEGSHG